MKYVCLLWAIIAVCKCFSAVWYSGKEKYDRAAYEAVWMTVFIIYVIYSEIKGWC